MYASAQPKRAIPRIIAPRLATINNASEVPMNLHLSLTPIASLIAGALILIAPRLLNYIVAIYLILIGLVGLFGSGTLHLR
jgi:hypothetical protein